MRLVAALCTLAVCLGCQQKPPFSGKTVTVVAGKEVTLVPEVSGNWTEISWKKDEHIVAELEPNVWYSESLRNRAKLDETSGALTFTKPQQNDSGNYRVEAVVESKYQCTFFQLDVLEHPEPPQVTCTDTPEGIRVSCVAQNMSATYRWKYQKSQKAIPGNTAVILIRKTVDLSENITCVISVHDVEASGSIPLSFCIPEGAPPPKTTRGHLALLFAAVAVVVVGVVCWCWVTGHWKFPWERKGESPGCEDEEGGAEKQHLNEECSGNLEENRAGDVEGGAGAPPEKQHLNEECSGNLEENRAEEPSELGS